MVSLGAGRAPTRAAPDTPRNALREELTGSPPVTRSEYNIQWSAMTLTRRQFHAALACAATPAAAQQPASKLNVVLITNDQHRADCVGSYGNRVIRTPNLDTLAAEGLAFDRHFVQCPQ